jgi:hypothetical protein
MTQTIQEINEKIKQGLAVSFRNGSGPEAAVKARISELERIIGKQTTILII